MFLSMRKTLQEGCDILFVFWQVKFGLDETGNNMDTLKNFCIGHK